MSDEQADETSIPFVPDKYFRDFLERGSIQPSHVHFSNEFQRIAAEMNRRLVRQQVRLIAAQGVLLESQERVAKSLTRATWVLSIATIVLAFATIWPVLWHMLRP